MNDIVKYPATTKHWVACSCCGKDIPDNPKHNSHYGDDGEEMGMGMCVSCGGVYDKDEDTFEVYEKMTDDEIWKHRGWAEKMFYTSRFGFLENTLNEKNSANFAKLPTWKKILIVQSAIKDGVMI